MSQLNAAGEYVTLYDPITGATDGHGRRAEPTPEEQLSRSFNLRQAFEDVKGDMLVDIAGFEASVIKPGSDARDYIQPLRRTIKKRENKRMDYEKCQEKVKKLQRKPGKSAKEDNQIHKAEDELARATEVGTHAISAHPALSQVGANLCSVRVRRSSKSRTTTSRSRCRPSYTQCSISCLRY